MPWIIDKIRDILPNRPYGKTSKDNRMARLIDLNRVIDNINEVFEQLSNTNIGNNLTFKPGSVGEKVSFRKVSGSDPNTNKDIIIPGLLEITRENGGGGIYNIAVEGNFQSSISPQNTFWTTKYLDPTSTGWSPLWDFASKTYDNWRDAVETPEGSNVPPMYVGLPAVMKYDDGNIVKYYLIMFTEWGVGGEGQYGFAYDRYEILDSVLFEKPSTGNISAPKPIDIISDGVQITRGNNGGLYNPLFESGDNWGASPANTRWNSVFTDSRTGYSGFDDLSNLESRVYTAFIQALDGNVGNNLPGTDLIMHDLTTDLYYKVVFDQWAQGCGNQGYNQGEVLGYSINNSGSGYQNGTYSICATGGTGNNFCLNLTVSGGTPTIDSYNGGSSYTQGDVVTFSQVGVTNPIVILIEDVCEQGGFSYKRTVIPQSYGIKFADGTVMNTASTGGSDDLQQVTDLGNTTTNDINLDNSAIVLDNGSSLRKGWLDNGADGGIARECAVNYQDQWENGVQYFINQGGQVVRANSINGSVPNLNFDITRGYIVGSIFHDMNNQNKYICTDNTNGAAVWELYYDPIPYKVYTALLSQVGIMDPIATVLENTLPTLPIWVRDTDGQYSISNISFDPSKTFYIVSGNPTFNPNFRIGLGFDGFSNKIIVSTLNFSSSAGTDSVLNNTSIEIRVYN